METDSGVVTFTDFKKRQTKKETEAAKLVFAGPSSLSHAHPNATPKAEGLGFKMPDLASKKPGFKAEEVVPRHFHHVEVIGKTPRAFSGQIPLPEMRFVNHLNDGNFESYLETSALPMDKVIRYAALMSVIQTMDIVRHCSANKEAVTRVISELMTLRDECR